MEVEEERMGDEEDHNLAYSTLRTLDSQARMSKDCIAVTHFSIRPLFLDPWNLKEYGEWEDKGGRGSRKDH